MGYIWEYMGMNVNECEFMSCVFISFCVQCIKCHKYSSFFYSSRLMFCGDRTVFIDLFEN